MAATGNEVAILSQIKSLYENVVTKIAAKLTTPATEGNAGDVLTTDGAGTYTWTTPAAGTVYTATAPIEINDSVISVATAGVGAEGVVSFVSDEDFASYMGLS